MRGERDNEGCDSMRGERNNEGCDSMSGVRDTVRGVIQ